MYDYKEWPKRFHRVSESGELESATFNAPDEVRPGWSSDYYALKAASEEAKGRGEPSADQSAKVRTLEVALASRERECAALRAASEAQADMIEALEAQVAELLDRLGEAPTPDERPDVLAPLAGDPYPDKSDAELRAYAQEVLQSPVHHRTGRARVLEMLREAGHEP